MKNESIEVLYLESSAAISYFLKESSHEKILDLLNRSETVCTSILGILEIRRVLRRAYAEKRAPQGSLLGMLGLLEKYLNKWVIMDLIPEVQKRVGENFPFEPIRTLDAIHLASALEFSKMYPSLQVLTMDRKILSNLEGLGLDSIHLKASA